MLISIITITITMMMIMIGRSEISFGIFWGVSLIVNWSFAFLVASKDINHGV